jgi:hypothetical protein
VVVVLLGGNSGLGKDTARSGRCITRRTTWTGSGPDWTDHWSDGGVGLPDLIDLIVSHLLYLFSRHAPASSLSLEIGTARRCWGCFLTTGWCPILVVSLHTCFYGSGGALCGISWEKMPLSPPNFVAPERFQR